MISQFWHVTSNDSLSVLCGQKSLSLNFSRVNISCFRLHVEIFAVCLRLKLDYKERIRENKRGRVFRRKSKRSPAVSTIAIARNAVKVATLSAIKYFLSFLGCRNIKLWNVACSSVTIDTLLPFVRNFHSRENFIYTLQVTKQLWRCRNLSLIKRWKIIKSVKLKIWFLKTICYKYEAMTWFVFKILFRLLLL